MADNPRIEDLRRRVQKDPASIAFAQLAEEYRRAGQLQEAVDACRAGLAIHPAYLSARVTLGRALIELDQLDEAKSELDLVLANAPENLAAIRGLAEIYHRRGALDDALTQYRAALNLARNDPDLEETVTELTRELEPAKGRQSEDGLSFAQIQDELLIRQKAQPPAVKRFEDVRISGFEDVRTPGSKDAKASHPRALTSSGPDVLEWPNPQILTSSNPQILPNPPAHASAPAPDAARLRAQRTIDTLETLEQWLAALHVTRADPHA